MYSKSLVEEVLIVSNHVTCPVYICSPTILLIADIFVKYGFVKCSILDRVVKSIRVKMTVVARKKFRT